jgi:spore coat protein U-like protein
MGASSPLLIGGGSTDTVAFTMLLSAGSSGSVTNRKMTGDTPPRHYNLYTSASYSTIWDHTTGVAGSMTIVGLLGLPVPIFGSATVIGFGRILASRAVPAGSYMDSLTITINY